MAKRIIIGIVAFFIIMSAITFWLFNSIGNTDAENKARTEADFVKQPFVITELWEMQRKKGSTLLSSYLFFKVKDEQVNFRIPFQGTDGDNMLARQMQKGDTVLVKVLKRQLAEARKEGAGKSIQRFIMGDKREVAVYGLSIHDEMLVNKDIHDWDQANISLFGRLTDNPYILFVPAFLLFAVIGLVKRKGDAKSNIT